MKNNLSIVLFLVCFLGLKSQAYEFFYHCERKSSNDKYDFVQKFDNEKYYYSVTRLEDDNPYQKYTINIYLDPITLLIESMDIPKGMSCFNEDISWYKKISRDDRFALNVEFKNTNRTKKEKVFIEGQVKEINLKEYILVNKENNEPFYEVYVIDSYEMSPPMLYNKKNLLKDWTYMFYAYKNSRMDKVIYSFNEIKDSHNLKCTMTSLHKKEDDL